MKTITLLDKDDTPAVTLLKGHHSLEAFNLAAKAEGWDNPWLEISHEWWVEFRPSEWKSSNKETNDAEPVTVGEW